MKKTLLAAVSAVALSTSGAMADGHLPFDDGFYVGINGGIAWLDGDADITVGGVNTDFDLKDSGFTGGGQIGYNMQHDQFMLGLEADINFLDLDDSGQAPGATTGRFNFDADWYATIRARGGIVFDNTLLFAGGGIALMGAELTATPIIAAAAGASNRDDEVLFGYALNAGFEHKFDEDWSGKVEYVYMNFDRERVTAGPASVRFEPEVHVFRVGINWHFCSGGGC